MSYPLTEDVLAHIGQMAPIDMTRAHLHGVPANFLTAMRYPCHDRDVLRDLLASSRLSTAHETHTEAA